MAVFVSYSSRDRALLDGVLGALRRAHERVWLDEELGGGEAWWREILEQIRRCDVFIVALSQNMLESKACQAELRYARDLGKPILPVQVGPLDNMRINPLSQMQVIDYREPSIETGIELVSSVHARRAKSTPLPDPLPEEPPIPFAYLMRLASTISDPSPLSPQEQTTLVAELKAGLEEDGNDVSARRDITQLLCMLRDRPDVTWRTRTEVEAVLVSLQNSAATTQSGQPAPAGAGTHASGTGPQPGYVTAPQPAYQPPPPMGPPPGPPGYGYPGAGPGRPGKTSKSGTKWLIVGGAAVAAVIAIVVLVAAIAVGGNGSHPTPTPSSPVPTVAPSALNSLLLTAREIDSIMGTTNIEAGTIRDEMTSDAPSISNPDCAGAQYTGLKVVYEGTGYSAVADQILTSGQSTDDKYAWVGQTAVAFPSADQAGSFLKTSADNWKKCAGQTVTVTNSTGEKFNWTYDDVSDTDSHIGQLQTQEGMRGYACQHVMRTVSNVIVEAQACQDHVTDQAARIADQMAGKAPTS